MPLRRTYTNYSPTTGEKFYTYCLVTNQRNKNSHQTPLHPSLDRRMKEADADNTSTESGETNTDNTSAESGEANTDITSAESSEASTDITSAESGEANTDNTSAESGEADTDITSVP